MSRIVNVKGQEIFNRFAFDAWSTERKLDFLEMAIELRVKHLLEQIDPQFIASANVVNRRLKLPLQCQQELALLKESHELGSSEFRQELLRIEALFFGALETQ